MRQLTWKIVLPLTVISFATFTKWWYILPDDAPDTMMAGFPIAFVCDGWYTSGSLQIFIAEFILDLLIYLIFWFLLIFCIDRFLTKIRIHKILTISLSILSGLILTGTIMIAIMPEHVYKAKRDFDLEVMVTGYKFIWQHQERPDFTQYDPRKKQK